MSVHYQFFWTSSSKNVELSDDLDLKQWFFHVLSNQSYAQLLDDFYWNEDNPQNGVILDLERIFKLLNVYYKQIHIK